MRVKYSLTPPRGKLSRTAVIFDLDGTLIDSAEDIADAANAVLVEAGAAPVANRDVLRMVGGGAPKLLERIFGKANVPLSDPKRLLDRFLTHYHAGSVTKTRPYPGVTGLLRRLRRAGHPLAICTNKPGQATRTILRRLGWDGVFDVVLAGDDLPVKKPHAGHVLTTLRLLGVPPKQALFVGDSHVDVQAAHAAGLPVAILTHGYAHGPVSCFGADYLLTNVRRLHALVGS